MRMRGQSPISQPATVGTDPSVAASLVSDRVFAQLLEGLLSGRYAAGEKLPTQRALAADLGVTMSSVREALKRLEQMGLVDVRHGSAMRVRDWHEHGGLRLPTHPPFPGGRPATAPPAA